MQLSAEYIAGLFDGEGSLSFMVCKTPQGWNSATAVVRVANGNRQVLEFIKTQFGGVLHTYKPRYPGAALNHVLHIHRRQAKRFLEAITPFLVIKRNLAWIVLCFLERGVRHRTSKKGQQGFQPLTKEDSELRAGLRELAMKINGRKGKPRTSQALCACACLAPK